MKYGDYTHLAKYYNYRPGYSILVLDYIKSYIQGEYGNIEKIADIGAGTGKLTENLSSIGLQGYAIEPNFYMRKEGMKNIKKTPGFTWIEGRAEKTNLEENSVDWILMGSSFHWTNYKEAVKEFYRILKPGGYFTAIWNPRNISSSELHKKIEECVYNEMPNMKRVSSGKDIDTNKMKTVLLKEGLFKNLIFIEAEHMEEMTKERYMNIWKSVNDIRVQAGEEKFQVIMSKIEEIIEELESISVSYLSRSWTVKSSKYN